MTSPLRVRYQTIEFGAADIHLCTLRDKQQFSDPLGVADGLGISSASWPLFGVVWPSGLVLANFMLDYTTTGKRILELGCGMALSSHLLNARQADITATDYHPEAEFFLNRNTRLNNGKTIPFARTSWADNSDQLGRFDLIIGSDVLYEDGHIALLSAFIQNHANVVCDVIIVDPGRGRKNKFSALMQTHGFRHHHLKPALATNLEQPFKGDIMSFSRGAEASPTSTTTTV